jgi:23S rRNA (adenine2503-C2)-methyltransferase
MNDKQLLRTISIETLKDWLTENHEKSFRAQQIMSWIWQKGVPSIHEMTNIPEALRMKLQDSFLWDRIQLVSFQQSSDKTLKAAFKLYDGPIIEGVIIPSEKRITACISTQAGCPVKCVFCATGQLGLTRNLTTGEIYDQVIDLNHLSEEHFGQGLTNIVIMGMGEPLLNFGNTVAAIKKITGDEGLGWSPHRITLSTVGIPEGIIQLANENLGINIALSLHSAIQEKREKLIPFAKKYTLDILLQALKKYTELTHQKITFEYLMLQNINDSIDDAKALARFASVVNSKINLIQFNSIDNSELQPSLLNISNDFLSYLHDKHFVVKLRKSRGIDIDAACGQLANKIINNK